MTTAPPPGPGSPRDQRDPLLDRLAETWHRHDPVPSGVVDRALATVHAAAGPDDLDVELELLLLVERSDELVGTRAAGDTITLRFSGDEVQLLLRVTPTGPDSCRVDGWLTPDDGVTVTAVQDGSEVPAVVERPGRFEFPTLRRGTTRLVVEPVDPTPTASARALGTRPFDL